VIALVGVLSHMNNESEGFFMFRSVVLAVTRMVGMAAWPAAAQDEAAEQGDQTGQFVLGVMFFPQRGAAEW
jgi:hypothetical protein